MEPGWKKWVGLEVLQVSPSPVHSLLPDHKYNETSCPCHDFAIMMAGTQEQCFKINLPEFAPIRHLSRQWGERHHDSTLEVSISR